MSNADKTITNSNGQTLIYLDEPHTYTVEDQSLKSVTTIIHDWFPPFEKEKIATNYARKNGHNAEYWMHQWDLMADFGTKMHAYSEALCLNKKRIAKAVGEKEIAYYKAINEFVFEYIKKHYDVVDSEKITFSMEYLLAGTIDLLLRHRETGKILIADWKTNKRISMSGFRGSTGFRQLSHLEDCNHAQYSVQLNVYRHLLEMEQPNQGFIDGDMVLYHITSDGIISYPVEKMDKEVEIIFNERLKGI